MKRPFLWCPGDGGDVWSAEMQRLDEGSWELGSSEEQGMGKQPEVHWGWACTVVGFSVQLPPVGLHVASSHCREKEARREGMGWMNALQGLVIETLILQQDPRALRVKEHME